MKIRIIRLDSTNPNFSLRFRKYESAFFEILRSSYPNYYGDDYQLERIKKGKAVLYLATVNGKLAGASYVKRNKRRGGTAIYPETFRGLGLGLLLIQESLKDFPSQYTILNARNLNMLKLLKKAGFKYAESEEVIKEIVGSEFNQLSGFKIDEHLVFNRSSVVRAQDREYLNLLYI